MWQCNQCKSYNADGLQRCRCGGERAKFVIPNIPSTGTPKPRKQANPAKVKEGREYGQRIRQNQNQCVNGEFFQSQFRRIEK